MHLRSGALCYSLRKPKLAEAGFAGRDHDTFQTHRKSHWSKHATVAKSASLQSFLQIPYSLPVTRYTPQPTSSASDRQNFLLTPSTRTASQASSDHSPPPPSNTDPPSLEPCATTDSHHARASRCPPRPADTTSTPPSTRITTSRSLIVFYPRKKKRSRESRAFFQT